MSIHAYPRDWHLWNACKSWCGIYLVYTVCCGQRVWKAHLHFIKYFGTFQTKSKVCKCRLKWRHLSMPCCRRCWMASNPHFPVRARWCRRSYTTSNYKDHYMGEPILRGQQSANSELILRGVVTHNTLKKSTHVIQLISQFSPCALKMELSFGLQLTRANPRRPSRSNSCKSLGDTADLRSSRGIGYLRKVWYCLFQW